MLITIAATVAELAHLPVITVAHNGKPRDFTVVAAKPRNPENLVCIPIGTDGNWTQELVEFPADTPATALAESTTDAIAILHDLEARATRPEHFA